MKKVVRIVNSVSRGTSLISTGVVVAMMMLLVTNVVGRYFLGRPVKGTSELVELMMVCVVFLALAWCAVQGAHIKVGLVVERFSPRVQAIVDSFTHLVGLGICTIIIWRNIVRAIDVHELGLTTMLLRIPRFPFHLVIAVGLIILCLVMVTQLIQYLVKAVKG